MRTFQLPPGHGARVVPDAGLHVGIAELGARVVGDTMNDEEPREGPVTARPVPAIEEGDEVGVGGISHIVRVPCRPVGVVLQSREGGDEVRFRAARSRFSNIVLS